MSDEAPSVAELAAAARSLLAFQGELGLRGVDAPSELLTRRPVQEPVQEPVPSPSEPAATAPVAAEVRVRSSDPGEALEQVRTAIGDCSRCKLARGRTNIVFGVGNPRARLMFVGEAPGRDEDLQAEPFVGAAGKLLDKMIVAMGLQRRDVYIANIAKCRPPRNRDPEPDEVEACEPFLIDQIRVIRPEVLVALGRHAAQTLLRDSTPITRMRGVWREYEGIPLMPTYHPAYLLRNAKEKRPVWQDLQQVMHRLGLPNLHASS